MRASPIDGNKFEIVDLGSKNGVLVNGKKTPRRFLRNGDVITLGMRSSSSSRRLPPPTTKPKSKAGAPQPNSIFQVGGIASPE